MNSLPLAACCKRQGGAAIEQRAVAFDLVLTLSDGLILRSDNGRAGDVVVYSRSEYAATAVALATSTGAVRRHGGSRPCYQRGRMVGKLPMFELTLTGAADGEATG